MQTGSSGNEGIIQRAYALVGTVNYSNLTGIVAELKREGFQDSLAYFFGKKLKRDLRDRFRRAIGAPVKPPVQRPARPASRRSWLD